MSYSIKTDNFKFYNQFLILKAGRNKNLAQYSANERRCSAYKNTKNGYIFVYSDVETQDNLLGSQIANEAILNFFTQQYYSEPQTALEEAIKHANRLLYYNYSKNNKLANLRINCIALLIRQSRVFFAYTGTAHLYCTVQKQAIRITPEGQSTSETNRISGIAGPLIASKLILDLNVNSNNPVINMQENDFLAIISNETYKTTGNDKILSLLEDCTNIREKAFSLLSSNIDNNISNGFYIFRFTKNFTEKDKNAFWFKFNAIISLIIEIITSKAAMVVMFLIILILLIIYINKIKNCAYFPNDEFIIWLNNFC